MTEVTLAGTVAKLDQAKQLVFGFASIVERNGLAVIDLQGDEISSADLESCAYRFALTSRNADELHQVAGVGKLIESFVCTPEKLSAMQESLNSQGIQCALSVDAIFWWIGFHIDSPVTWAKISSGELKAFSLFGKGRRHA